MSSNDRLKWDDNFHKQLVATVMVIILPLTVSSSEKLFYITEKISIIDQILEARAVKSCGNKTSGCVKI